MLTDLGSDIIELRTICLHIRKLTSFADIIKKIQNLHPEISTLYTRKILSSVTMRMLSLNAFIWITLPDKSKTNNSLSDSSDSLE